MTFLNAQSVVGGQTANKQWQLYTVLLQLIPSCANQMKLVGKWSKMYAKRQLRLALVLPPLLLLEEEEQFD